MILSFGWTAQYLQHKTVTRRTWAERTAKSWCKAWDEGRHIHQAWNKSTFAKGARKLCDIKLTARPYQEYLADMPESDVVAEGGMVETVQEFIDKYFNGNASQVVWVVRFEVVGEIETEEAK